MLRFLFVDKRELFAMKLCFEEFNLVFFAGIRVLGLFWTNRGSEVSEETWGTFCNLWSRKVRLLKEIFVFIKVSWTFATFWHWRERKTRKCAFEIDFFAMRSADWTCVNGSRIQLVLFAKCFLGLTYGFFNKNFQGIKLFIYHFSFITLSQNTIVRLQPQNVLFSDQNDWYNVLGSGEPYKFEPPVLEEESYASNNSFDGLKRERMIHFLYKWLLWKRRYIIEVNTFRNVLRKFCDLLPLPHAVSLFGFCCVRAHVELRFECEGKCTKVLLFRVIYIHVQHVVMWCS